MAHALRHSHIAICKTLPALAAAAGERILSGEDDFGPYGYFDLLVGVSEGRAQHVRFASHKGDTMVHLLAETITDTLQLAEALWRVGVGRAGLPRAQEISISRDQDGHPVRDETEILIRLLELYERDNAIRADERSDPSIAPNASLARTAALKALK